MKTQTQKEIDQEVLEEMEKSVQEAKDNGTYGTKKPNAFWCSCGFGTTTQKRLDAHTCFGRPQLFDGRNYWE